MGIARSRLSSGPGTLFFIALWCTALAFGSLRAQEQDVIKKHEGLSHPLAAPGTQDIARIWRDCLTAHAEGDLSGFLLQLDRLKAAQLDSGIPNLTPISAALIRIASEIAEKTPSEADVALSVARHAQNLSPDIPDFSFARSNLIWRVDKSQVGELARDFFYGVRLSFTHQPSLRALLLVFLSVVWGVGLLVMVFFSVMVLIRYLSLFGHDFGHLLPRSLSKLQLNVIALILLFVPFLADVGVVPLFALWWVVFWVYQSRTEKVVTLAMVVFICLWPLVNGLFLGGIAYSGSLAEKGDKCRTQICSWEEVRELESVDLTEKYGDVALLSGANAWFRDSHRYPKALEKAFELYRRGTKELSGPERAWFHVGLGNVFVTKGMARCRAAGGNLEAGLDDFQSANKNYDMALALDDRNWAALYNKYRVLTILDMSDEAREMHDRAFSLAAKKVNELRERAGLKKEGGCGDVFVPHRELAIPEMTPPLISMGSQDSRQPGSLLLAHSLLLGPMTSWMLMPLAGGVLLCLMLAAGLRRSLKPSSRCTKCNRVSCIKCRPELSGTGLCNQCMYYKIRASYLDPKETWLREKRIENRLSSRRKLERFLTFVAPGAGHMLRGKAARGTMFMWILGSALAFVFFPPVVGMIAWVPLTPLATGSVISVAFWSLTAFVVYFLALLDIYSWR